MIAKCTSTIKKEFFSFFRGKAPPAKRNDGNENGCEDNIHSFVPMTARLKLPHSMTQN